MVPSMRSGRGATLAALLFVLLATPDVAAAANGNWVPKGHYLSFDRSRNLRTEMLDLVRRPETARSNYHLGMAQNLHQALRTPGVKGVWMQFSWRDVELADGQFDFSLMDDNIQVLQELGLKFIIKIADRSFSGSEVMPEYFPPEYVLESAGGGKSGYTSKRWDPYVYNRLVRIYSAIAGRYAANPAFAGIATAETATGYSGGDYTVDKYSVALDQIVTRTQSALTRGKLFFYLNFLPGGDTSDMNEDARVALLKDVPHHNLVIGAPDITPDVRGMPRSATAYRIHARKNMAGLAQFCHLQHVDQGLGGRNVKTNQYRQEYLDEVQAARHREQQSWFKGEPAVFEFDDLRDPGGHRVTLHPAWVLGHLWTPAELFSFGHRNFDCDYALWHYREHPQDVEFGWADVQPVIENNPCFYAPGGCAGAALSRMPQPPSLR